MSIVEMKVPVIGESINEVTLSEWLKADGEYVEMDEPICEFESDKATLEFPAEAAGKLIYVAAEGDDLEIGALVAKIDTSVSKPGGTAPQSSEPKATETEEEATQISVVTEASVATEGGKVVEMKVPVIGESINEVTLSEWLKADGDIVQMDEPICEFESDKATLEFPAEASGKLIHVATEGSDLEIGALVAKIDTSFAAASSTSSAETPATSTTTTSTTSTSTSTNTNYATGHPSPAAAKILKEKNIPATAVQGSGRDGRITKADAVSATPPAAKPASAPKPAPTKAAPTPAVETPSSFSRATRSEKMSRMRRTIAKRLLEAKHETAMLTTFNEVDLTEVMALRKKYQERFVDKHGVKLGFMSLFAKACAKALMEMPEVNAMIDGNNIVYHDYVDISFAISTPTGLVVPPIKNIESLHFADIEKKLKELAGKARNGTLSLEEMKGGTFAITNGGVFGSLLSTPILNRPQSAILGMHGIKQRPMVIDGEVKIRPMMYLALSYDHRVIDGSSSVRFLVRVIELLEDPITLLMDM